MAIESYLSRRGLQSLVSPDGSSDLIAPRQELHELRDASMREFFHGWRRKTGIVTLVLACVFMAGWVRSHFVCDHPHVFMGKIFIEAVTIHDHVFLQQHSFGQGGFFFGWKTPHDFETLSEAYGVAFEWAFILCGFGFSTADNGREILLLIPYWSIVILLTLLSAYLLLSKPRVAKPPYSSFAPPSVTLILYFCCKWACATLACASFGNFLQTCWNA